MMENDREMLLHRLKVDGRENALTKFLKKNWNRNLKIEFGSYFMPVYILCRDPETGTFHRRGGAVLEVKEKKERVEPNRWVAVFYSDKNTRYYLDYLKEISEPDLEKEGVTMDSVYECPHRNIERNIIRGQLEKEKEEQIAKIVENRWDEGL
ncbi:unnamed protein product [Caenorhabditis nigoni]